MDHERIMAIHEYMSRFTDKNKSVTVKDIQNYLSDNTNFKNVSDLTIRRDIDRLTNSGYNIVKSSSAHNKFNYKLLDRDFDFNEIRFIVDSISINKYLSIEQKTKIIKKFEGKCSDSQVRELMSRVSVNVSRAESFDLLENLEKVHQIISQKKKINFEYGKIGTGNEIVYEKKDRLSVPLEVLYYTERFYLRCYDITRDMIRTYRIDRMRNIVEGKKVDFSYKMPEPEGATVDIFQPVEYVTVSFRVKSFLKDDIIEQLGSYVSFRKDLNDPS